MERIFVLCNGDRLTCTEKAAIFRFSAPRKVLSTGANGGGIRSDLTAALTTATAARQASVSPWRGKTYGNTSVLWPRDWGWIRITPQA